MKKSINFILIFVVMLSLLTSCSDKVKYTVYYGTTASGENQFTDYIKSNNESIDLKPSTDILFPEMIGGQDIAERGEAESTKTFTINGKKILAQYNNSLVNECQTSNHKKLKTYRYTDTYIYDDGGNIQTFHVNPETGHMLVYFLGDSSIRNADGSLTKDEASKIAKDFIVTTYGEEVLETHVFDSVSNINNDSPPSRGYLVTYKRFINGYETDDTIRIRMNMNGVIYSVNATNIDVYSNIEIDLSESQIKKAEKKIIEIIDLPNCEIDPSIRILKVDINGSFYLEIGVTHYRDGEIYFADSYYINVN